MTTALITGATAGLGAEFARQLAARGTHLVLVARNAERLEDAAATLRARGVDVEVLVADLADRAAIDRVRERLLDQGRPIDVLVNNAGFGTSATLLDEDTSEHERSLQVMALAPMLLGNAAARAMRVRGHGRIITVASLSAWITQGSYSAVKAYAKVWSEGLAGELAGSGVTSTALCPGWVRTEFFERAGFDQRVKAIPSWAWVDARTCVARCLEDAEKGRVLSIPTPKWKAAAFALQHLPRSGVHLIGRAMARVT